MIITEKRRRRISYLVISFIIICITPLCEKSRILNGAAAVNNSFTGEEITCAIDLGDDMYGAHGLKTGFSYELLKKFAADNRCDVNIVISCTGENYADSLADGKIDILITSYPDSSVIADMNARQVDSHTLWAVDRNQSDKARTLDIWMSHIKGSHEYDNLQKKYYRSFNPHRKAAKGMTVSEISPYDDLFKKYSAQLGWDWRMLAAVVYQESKFSINSVSHRGAKGLMQVMPHTGKCYGVTDLTDPEQNLLAGVSHLKRLQNLYIGSGMDKNELIKFTLAAYNAGEGRISDCRKFAESKGEDKNSWAVIVDIIPLMREDAILEEESVKLGKFQGFETISYIESIMALYESICAIHPQA